MRSAQTSGIGAQTRKGILLVTALAGVFGCERGAPKARPSTSSIPVAVPTAPANPTPARAEPAAAWPTGLGEREMLVRLRTHYRDAGRAARAVLATASSKPVQYEAEWLLKVYDHVVEHFEVALRDWYGPAAAAEPDLALQEFTDPKTIADVKERERRFAAEVLGNHERLIAFVRTPDYTQFAAQRELLREIRLDVETSQATQVQAFQAAVLGPR
jgi:hypothetical protein